MFNNTEHPLTTAPSPAPASVLVVDDNVNNLRVVEGILRDTGYRVRMARTGESALRSIEIEIPDIILLDIRMPEMDGYEVCSRLKAVPATAEIPVIFLSALQDVEDKVRAFQVGGVDYVVKPFQAEEVLSRVRTHLDLARTRRSLTELNLQLEQRVVERTHELMSANEALADRAEQEQILNDLMQLALTKSGQKEFLGRAIGLLNHRFHWQGIAARNLVFLRTEDGREPQFELVAASAEIDRADQQLCRKLAPVQCSCFRSVLEGKTAFHEGGPSACDALDKLSGGPIPRYWVPLMEGRRVIGALVHYLEPGTSEDALDQTLMLRLGELLSLGILRRQADEMVIHQAFHDPLTGLPNRRLFENRLEHALARAKRMGNLGTILFLDLDRFKNVNDVLGHSSGDQILLNTAERLRQVLRKDDVLARWGGDEFLVMLPNVGSNVLDAGQTTLRIAEKLREALNQPIDLAGTEVQVGVSIGATLFPSNGVAVEEFIKRADTAMYRAKHAGRNTIQFFEQSMQQDAERTLLMERRLRKSITERQFMLYYQPQVSANGRLVGVEALLRWPQPDGSLIPPGEFIPLAEDTGLIVPLGEWVLEESTHQFAQLLSDHAVSPNVSLAINVSARQFESPGFVAAIERSLGESGLPPRRLKLEVTESVLMKNLEQALEIMDWLDAKGIDLSIDDFGTGYSSFAYLKRLPIRQIKIDQTFVSGIRTSTHDATIVAAIIGMARRLDMETVAEGVETLAELRMLRRLGCQYFQGYYFSRPRPWDDVAAMLIRGDIGEPDGDVS
ncbi:MAG: EAL domain-containing protein [Methylococcaceae bacterium]|nr:EAL domain-containing protein [Methylococcaceae bacterium]